MKLVIDIPEALYEECKRLGDKRDTLFEAIRNGTLLPKGHGRLIDSDKLIEKWNNTPQRGRTEFDQIIMCEPTVIPADKEVK